MTMSPLDPNTVLLTGENPVMNLSETDDQNVTTNATIWRIRFSPAGAGHALFIKSELTDDEVRIYSDNIHMTRWLQSTIIRNPLFNDTAVSVIDSECVSAGDTRSFWTETIVARDEVVSLTWHDLGEPALFYVPPDDNSPLGHGAVFIAAGGARLTINDEQAKGHPLPRERFGATWSNTGLYWSESWTQRR